MGMFHVKHFEFKSKRSGMLLRIWHSAWCESASVWKKGFSPSALRVFGFRDKIEEEIAGAAISVRKNPGTIGKEAPLP